MRIYQMRILILSSLTDQSLCREVTKKYCKADCYLNVILNAWKNTETGREFALQGEGLEGKKSVMLGERTFTTRNMFTNFLEVIYWWGSLSGRIWVFWVMSVVREDQQHHPSRKSSVLPDMQPQMNPMVGSTELKKCNGLRCIRVTSWWFGEIIQFWQSQTSLGEYIFILSAEWRSKTERQRSDSLPNACDSWGWDRPKPGHCPSIQVSLMNDRSPTSYSIAFYPPGYTLVKS